MKSLAPLLLGALLLAGFAEPPASALREEIPFVPTPDDVIDRMLELAEVTERDVVYDLGSGDGRIVIRAAKKFGARAVGIEMDTDLVALSTRKAEEEGVSHLVEFRAQDALVADISPATVVTLYMFPWFNDMMRPALQQKLRPGARVVSHDFGINGWPPTEVVKLPNIQSTPGGYTHQHILYLWRVKEGF